MSNATLPRLYVRVVNALCAVALCALVLGSYLPMVRVLDLSRADLGLQSEWIGDYSKRVTGVAAGGPADRAGLRAGDVIQFDPNRDADWVLAGYRDMPDGFSSTLPVRHGDGSKSVVALVPESVAYLPTLNDRLALVARLSSLVVMMLVAVVMVWARPGLMTWSLLIGSLSGFPARVFADFYLGFEARPGSNLMYFLPPLTMAMVPAFLPFALSFPRNSAVGWHWWQRAAGPVIALVWIAFVMAKLHMRAFEGPVYERAPYLVWVIGSALALFASIAALARTYRRSDGQARARLKWALLGLSVALANFIVFMTVLSFSFVTGETANGSQLTPGNWVFAVTSGILFPLSFGYAVLRERVVDVQFAVSRTLVYGTVTTVALVFLTAVHWLLGRAIEHSGLAIGLEGIAAVGLGLVLHRASHHVNVLVDRVLFRKHHQAEERLRRVTTALPFATDERSIAESLVTEPTRNLDLASAALFYRTSTDASFSRVLAHGWSDDNVASLDANGLLVRYLQTAHEPLRLDDPHLVPGGVPEGAAMPVLAIPVVNQHLLTAVVLYGAHTNSTLPDPDEVEILHALAKAAATAHQQVRIATLAQQNESKRTRIIELEASLRALGHERLVGAPECGKGGRPV